MTKQLLSNFQVENSSKRHELEAELKNRAACKKTCIQGFHCIAKYLKVIGNCLDLCSSGFENLVLLGGLNSKITENAVEEFLLIYKLYN